MDLELRGHVALVTGAASGIGRAIAEAFAAEGVRVALWDLAANIPQVASEVAHQHAVETLGVIVDVANESSVSAAYGQTVARLAPVDHVVHAAAIGSGKFGFPFTNLTPADWRRPLEVNVMGQVHLAHVAAPDMVARRSGTMIFIASVAGQIGSQTDPPYSASKAANINFSQCLARDLAPHGIRVNSVCPGIVATPLSRSIWQAWNDMQPADKKRTYEDWAGEKVNRVVPMGTYQQPQDIAHMVVFLSSPRAGQVTGQTINVDGGFVMR